MTPLSSREGKLKRDGLRILERALSAADGGRAVRRCEYRLDAVKYERVFLVAVGKAAVPMAQAAEELVGRALTSEIVVTKHGHVGGALCGCQPIEAGHPIPDAAGEQAAHSIRRLAISLMESDLLLVALSGGASALLPAPVGPVTLEAKQETTNLLLRAGANIQDLNAVRKHLSFLKGGLLAKLAYPATVVSLLLSDVIGDPLDVIGSGPTAPDESTFGEAIQVLRKFDLLARVPESVRTHLQEGAAGRIEETPKSGDPIFRKVTNLIIGSNRLALTAAAEEARHLGYKTSFAASSIDGETREAAAARAGVLREAAAEERPACILSGGETTVTVRGGGKGGRNQEFALAAAIEIAGVQNVAVLSVGTDGSDGPTDAAGAFATGTTVARAREAGMNPEEYLARNDSYPFFDALGDLIRTGPTGTNVMDIQILLSG